MCHVLEGSGGELVKYIFARSGSQWPFHTAVLKQLLGNEMDSTKMKEDIKEEEEGEHRQLGSSGEERGTGQLGMVRKGVSA